MHTCPWLESGFSVTHRATNSYIIAKQTVLWTGHAVKEPLSQGTTLKNISVKWYISLKMSACQVWHRITGLQEAVCDDVRGSGLGNCMHSTHRQGVAGRLVRHLNKEQNKAYKSIVIWSSDRMKEKSQVNIILAVFLKGNYLELVNSTSRLEKVW